MKPRLVALDIDGTIVHKPGSFTWADGPEGEPSERVRAAVRALAEARIGVVLASGRMYPGTARVHRSLGLASALVCQQGCAVHEGHGPTLHEFPLALELAQAVCEFARERGYAYEWFTPTRYLASRQTPESDVYAELSGVQPEYVERPEESGLVPTGAGIISSAEEAPEVHRELVHRFGDAMHVLDFPSVTVCVAADANKGHALELLAADLGVERGEVVAIGDSVNDAPMLAWAGRGYAVAHADRYAMDVADEVLEMEGDDGVALLLERMARG